MKIALAQLDPIVGDIERNVGEILSAYQRAVQEGARLCVTPELALFGYPPLDLLDRPEIVARNEKGLEMLKKATIGQSCALIVGHIAANPSGRGHATQNVLSVIENGKVVFRQAKCLLPTYDVFDEARYFEPGDEPELWNCDDQKIGFAICEDLWAKAGQMKRYSFDPVEHLAKLGPDFLISIAASPYEKEKFVHRESLHADAARALKAPLLYVNQTGATDEILFDGRSFLLDGKGARQGGLPPFETGMAWVEITKGQAQWLKSTTTSPSVQPEIEVLAKGLVTGIRSYFQRTGFKKALLGLSGGIDSALLAVLAVRALGKENVMGIGMPSQYSSDHSLEDAEILAGNLGLHFEVLPIRSSFDLLNTQLAKLRGGKLKDIAEENLQSRIRGVMLMSLSNHEGALVLTTGNKSEMAMGYCTLYGDMVGALAVIGDLFKTEVYALSSWINENWGAPIPERSITKAPSAELRPDQTDQDSLPAYELLDPMLKEYLEEAASVEALTKKHGDWVPAVIRTLEFNEYKRRQAAPVLKTSSKAFGIGRRIPIAKKWDQDAVKTMKK